ncbi:MAG: site-2 protease family protein [Candidatus Aenigmarchaeota archaeon]|nr:site-2 protease family protein [Candidatus Aenigmarchaeota archaeon]
MTFDLYTASAVAFIVLLAILVVKDRDKFTRDSIMLLRKTQRGKAFLTRLGERHPTFWKYVGMAGVFVGFGMSIWILWTFVNLSMANIISPKPESGLSLVLPSPGPSAQILPGVIAVPFWYWIITIALLAIVHEGMHGVMAAREKIRIKSLGWGLLLVIPLAFVEPDEKQLQKKSVWAQLRVFAAGSFANFVLGTLCLLLLSFTIGYAYQPNGVAFGELLTGSPAQAANLTGTILAIDGSRINGLQDLVTALEQAGVGKEIEIATSTPGGEKAYRLTTIQHPDLPNSSRGYIGIGGLAEYLTLKPAFAGLAGVFAFLAGTAPFYSLQNGGLLFYLAVLNIGIGAFNMMPIKALDGGRMWELAFQRVSRKHTPKVLNAITVVLIGLILLNFASVLVR